MYSALGGEGRSTEASPTHLRVVSDAAYKKETEDGYSLRGVTFLRGMVRDTFENTNAKVHVVDWVCKAQRHVCRSTFAAELLGAGDAVDQGILVSHMFYEIQHGALTAAQARERSLKQGFIPMALYVDAKSVYAATSATFIKIPAEKSLLSHVQFSTRTT